MATTLDLELVVHARESLARGIHAFELRRAAGDERPLPAFTAGSHVAVRTPGGDVRKYSLTNDPAEQDRYVIAVKREEAGRGGSANLVDAVQAGDVLACSSPVQSFALAPGARQFLFIAGGIGITPIVAMIRHLVATGDATFRLVYLTRDAESTAFREVLQAPELAGRVTLHHDGGDPDRAFDLWPLLEKPGAAHVYCCGPAPLLEAVRDMTGHWPQSAIHFESFVDAAARPADLDHRFTVRLARAGIELDVEPGQSILNAMRDAGCDAESSCEAGTCGTCRTRVLDGEVDHRDLVLAPDERDEWMMICVSRAKGDWLEIDR